jgi:hypothetical protein
MIYTWNVEIDALFHLPFADFWSNQYSFSHCEIKPKIMPKWPGFHCDSMRIGPIANRRTGADRGHQTADFTYRLCHDKIRTQILNWSKKCWLLRSGCCVKTRCKRPVPRWNRTRMRTGHLDPLVTLPSGAPANACWWSWASMGSFPTHELSSTSHQKWMASETLWIWLPPWTVSLPQQ